MIAIIDKKIVLKLFPVFRYWIIVKITKPIELIKNPTAGISVNFQNQLKGDTALKSYLLNYKWIKGQPLTGQLGKSREVQIQGAESSAKHRWTCRTGGMAVAHQRRAKTTVLCTLKSARKQGFLRKNAS